MFSSDYIDLVVKEVINPVNVTVEIPAVNNSLSNLQTEIIREKLVDVTFLKIELIASNSTPIIMIRCKYENIKRIMYVVSNSVIMINKLLERKDDLDKIIEW